VRKYKPFPSYTLKMVDWDHWENNELILPCLVSLSSATATTVHCDELTAPLGTLQFSYSCHRSLWWAWAAPLWIPQFCCNCHSSLSWAWTAPLGIVQLSYSCHSSLSYELKLLPLGLFSSAIATIAHLSARAHSLKLANFHVRLSGLTWYWTPNYWCAGAHNNGQPLKCHPHTVHLQKF
jgi:hypothetical protein